MTNRERRPRLANCEFSERSGLRNGAAPRRRRGSSCCLSGNCRAARAIWCAPHFKHTYGSALVLFRHFVLKRTFMARQPG